MCPGWMERQPALTQQKPLDAAGHPAWKATWARFKACPAVFNSTTEILRPVATLQSCRLQLYTVALPLIISPEVCCLSHRGGGGMNGCTACHTAPACCPACCCCACLLCCVLPSHRSAAGLSPGRSVWSTLLRCGRGLPGPQGTAARWMPPEGRLQGSHEQELGSVAGTGNIGRAQ